MKVDQHSDDDDESSSTSEKVEGPVAGPKAKRQKTTISSAVVPAPLEVVSENKAANAIKNPRKIIVLLDQARLETVKSKKGDFELLNCDDHRGNHDIFLFYCDTFSFSSSSLCILSSVPVLICSLLGFTYFLYVHQNCAKNSSGIPQIFALTFVIKSYLHSSTHR